MLKSNGIPEYAEVTQVLISAYTAASWAGVGYLESADGVCVRVYVCLYVCVCWLFRER